MHHIKKRPDTVECTAGGRLFEIVLPEPNLIEKMSPWTTNFRQIDAGPMQTQLRMRNGKALSLLEIGMDRAVHQQGQAPPETLTLGIVLSRSRLRWKNSTVDRKSLLSFGDESGFEGLSDASFHGITFSVSDVEVGMLADRLGLPINSAIRSSGVFRPSQDAVGLQSLAGLALSYLRPECDVAMTQDDEEAILALLLQVASLPGQLNERGIGQKRTRAVRMALEIMEENIEENVPISRICEASGVSLRTLNRAFREVYGLGPKAYYVRMRLGLLRRALLESDRSGSVADLANSLGFWHMGQLARDYRSQFGELPSETRG